MATNKAQYIGKSGSSDPQTEVREVELPVETWQKLDEIKLSGNRDTSKIDIAWVLNYYLRLCERSDDFTKGILPNKA